jgi:hypothetical protein
VPAGLVLAAVLLAGAAPAALPDRPIFASYDVVESTRTVSPVGERTSGTAGSVKVAGGRARWELPHGSFPRSSASVAIADGALVTLLDPKERLAASATGDDFTALFRGRPAMEGSAAATLRDISVRLAPDGKGRALEGRPTSKYLLEARWTLVLTTTGRIARVTTEIKGVIETVDEPAARSPFDGLGRLVPARAEAAEALDAELAKLPGLPVSAALDVTSKVVSEQAGMPSGTEPPPKPAEARQSITRRLSNLVVRKGAAPDDALFAIPPDFHSRGLDRIAPEGAP